MNQKSLFNQLELAYAPLTAYEFAIMKSDQSYERSLEKACLYIIGQRPVITFENVIPSTKKYELHFEIHQKGNPNILKCKLPLIQSILGTSEEDCISIGFNNLDKTKRNIELPYSNIHGFSIVKLHDIENSEAGYDFLIWFSPEKLLQNWWIKSIECEIEGDFNSFTKYKTHYVGKATKQSIIKRLKAHSAFPDILSLETPLTEKQLPANEIVILPFEFRDNIQIRSYGSESDKKNMIMGLSGDDYPNQEKVFLDAEKALIKAMKPSYNKELFDNYPVSKDGLYAENYDAISYTLIDPITLIYEHGEIRGALNLFGGDSILILNNKEFKLIRR